MFDLICCFNCGMMLGDKFILFRFIIDDLKLNNKLNTTNVPIVTHIHNLPLDSILEDIGIEKNKLCCRQHFMSNLLFYDVLFGNNGYPDNM